MTDTPARIPTPIDAIAERWVDTVADLLPEVGVYIGRQSRPGEYSDLSPAGADARADAARAVLTELRAAEPVDEVDRITKLDLERDLALELERHDARLNMRDVSVLASPAQEIREVFDLEATDTVADWEVVGRRLHNVRGAIDGYIESLREGIRQGVVPARRQVAQVITQAERTAASDGFFTDLTSDPRAGDEAVPAALAADLVAGAEEARAAYGTLIGFLRDELAPAAGEQDAVGREHYALASRYFLGATVDLDETYEWGLEELARMVAEQESIANEIRPGATVEEAIALLDEDPARKLHGTEALKTWMQETSDRAVADLAASHFDIPEPVRRLECLIAPSQDGIIYYTGPTDDFSRPGRMWWSVPPGVTEFNTWRELTTVYHEGVPGHHLQIGQAVYNRASLNAWRRTLAGTSGHAEGWALYAERLMEQLGYLDDPADRLGMLDGQRMRAARVVLDIGVHLGKPRPDGEGIWTGDWAFEFFARHVHMSQGFIDFEVNRYLGWPGQAPSYKIGQRIWEQLRDEVAEREGDAFDIKAFHKRALDIGGVGLDTLRTALLD
ncbi:DUF885 domain-containing protein [Galbitalea sp. SE-J8]|uniref:DUF885 domain-containing protein n=1 Tax=Galbitalea sp. SE-J8 TaxID=3054952 RepID=UPI00259CEACA|nr:DUF885 domain-containing protein [Galbitalea sp. SE-J8]MDM4763098.1 DUF885 domain-containing protein [Galbitalea sp. SE-J8]